MQRILSVSSPSIAQALELVTADITNPTELNAVGTAVPDWRLVRTSAAGTDQATLYRLDTSSDAVSAPFVMASATAGLRWVAIAGAYLYGDASSMISEFGANVNAYAEIAVQNRNSGASASSDLVATADNGTSTTHYVDMGINGSTGGAAPFTGANDAYLYTTDNVLHIGALGASGVINFQMGATPNLVARFNSPTIASGAFQVNYTTAATSPITGSVIIGTGTVATTVGLGGGAIYAGSVIASKQATAAGIQLNHNSATGNFMGSLVPANLTANRTWTFPDANFTITGGGTLALGGFTLTVPATGTAALLAANNAFTGANTFTNASGVTTLQAATQDAMRLLGRAGGTSSFIGSLTPTTLTASRTYTFPDASIVVSGSAAALTSGRVVFVTTGGALTDSADFTFSGTQLVLGTGVTSGMNIAATTGTTYAIQSTTTSQTNFTAAAMFVNGGLGVGLDIVMGNSNATGAQKTLRIYGGNTAASRAPVISLFRTSDSEAVIGQVSGALYIGSGGGIANFNDATIQAYALFNITASTMTFTDAKNIAVGTTTGTKIGTATTQKLGFWNATPVVQPSTTGTATGFTANVGTAVNDTSTFTGGTGATAYRISDIVLALKQMGALAA